jgi:purine catabolism regulator
MYWSDGQAGIGRMSVPGSLSVREVLDLDLLAAARVIGGVSGLDRRVGRLNVMTVPDIARWTKEHELLLMTGYPLPKDSGALIRLLGELNARGVAALGVKYGNYGPGLMPEVLRVADDLGLPIIEIPESVAFDDLLSRVLSDIANRQATALARAQEIHRALLQIFLGGGGLGDIVRELSVALGGAGVICVDPAGSVIAELADPAHWSRLRGHDLLDGSGAVAVGRMPAGISLATELGPVIVSAPVLAGVLRHGHLLAVAERDASLPVEAETMVQQSAMVAALEITQRIAVSAVERHYESNAIHELLTSGTFPPSFGWDLDRRMLVLVARRDGSDPLRDGQRRRLDIDAWVSTVRSVDRTAVAGGLGRDLVAVCGASGPSAAIARALADGVGGIIRRSFSIGVSDVVASADRLPAAYRHARTALDLAQRTAGPGAILNYPDLGLFRLLNGVDEGDARAFVEETLGALLARPVPERDDLLHTLDVLLTSHLNTAAAARALHFHYNTMRYRIRKLSRLVGPFTDDPQLCLRLSVALHILRLWNDVGG